MLALRAIEGAEPARPDPLSRVRSDTVLAVLAMTGPGWDRGASRVLSLRNVFGFRGGGIEAVSACCCALRASAWTAATALEGGAIGASGGTLVGLLGRPRVEGRP